MLPFILGGIAIAYVIKKRYIAQMRVKSKK